MMDLDQFVKELSDATFADLRYAVQLRTDREKLGAIDGRDAVYSAEELVLLRNGRWIEAVKAFRNRTGVCLKVSKDAIDAWRRRNGGLE